MFDLEVEFVVLGVVFLLIVLWCFVLVGLGVVVVLGLVKCSQCLCCDMASISSLYCSLLMFLVSCT